jgi:8-oxo-dGTP pyrophosphatase MutT (NUDIX family)
MYKVFINETPLILINTEGVLPEWKNDDNILVTRYLGKKKFLHNYVDLLEKSQRYHKVVIFHNDLDEIWHDFTSLYKTIEAAGGVVFNEKKEVLFIYRLSFWDLPKGKIEKGEIPEEAAIREVQEETGLVNINLSSHLINTYHTYIHKEKRVLKKTHWFKMDTMDWQLTPQYSEDIEKAEWLSLSQFLTDSPKTYNNILDVLNCVVNEQNL